LFGKYALQKRVQHRPVESSRFGLRIAHDKVLQENEAENLMVDLHKRAACADSKNWAAAQLDELIIMALLSSGLRNSEFCSLAVGDTILGSGTSAFVVRRPARRKRTVFVPRRVSSLVEQYAGTVRPRFLPEGTDPDDRTKPLLFNEHRRPFDRTGLYRRVVRILTEAGLGDRANVQLLRHTYGYLAYLRTGGNLLFVQRQLGHAHPATTCVYAKLVDESYSDLAERIMPGGRPMGAIEGKPGGKTVPRFDCEID
ncbi:MAG TPA: site-specific integrase, partial [Phycisphaerae bacterium]|nr:site-specific integrase [Phycisphaerae bacterium]